MEKLIEVLQQQIANQERQTKEQIARQEERHQEQVQRHQEQVQRHQEQEQRHQDQIANQEKRHLEQLREIRAQTSRPQPTTIQQQVSLPKFVTFDATTELWADYWKRFNTFVAAHSVAQDKMPQVFLTNQSPTIYKMLTNLAAQETNPKEVNDLTMTEITNYMAQQFDPKCFIVRERFRFWSEMKRKPGETAQELAIRIRQAAATCDFSSISNPLDEALRTRFICSIGNEAVLKALFKIRADELTFKRAVEVASETEEAAKVAKETVYGTPPAPVAKVRTISKPPKTRQLTGTFFSSKNKECYRCGNSNHNANDCRFKKATCHFCNITGHLQSVCRKKARQFKPSKVNCIEEINMLSSSCRKPRNSKLEVPISINSVTTHLELDTATNGNFLSNDVWTRVGAPQLQAPVSQFQSATKHLVPITGSFTAQVTCPSTGRSDNISFVVTTVKGLNLLGRDAISSLGISIDKFLLSNCSTLQSIQSYDKPDKSLEKACSLLCDEFKDVFKPELGCLRDYELDIDFKSDAKPVFLKPRPVPFALKEDLAQAYDSGIARGVWTPVQFCDWGTPVVPVRKRSNSSEAKAKLRICGDYSVTVNPSLETHRHPLPLPEDLMQKLGGGYGFSKIDLADAYNQIRLGPDSRKRLALSTHRGVLLQNVLPFGISSAPGYFQKIMDDLTADLPGVAVYLDDILVSGTTAEEHLQNLRRLLDRLHSKGLRCRKDKCKFAQPQVEYLGHILSRQGISKGPKVNAVLEMSAPTDVSSLRSFLGSLQFYSKFLPLNASTVAEPLYHLTKKDIPWRWGKQEENSFAQLKHHLSTDEVLTHFNASLPVGIACDASSVGIGATLFHRYPDGTERPIANVSKILTASQRNYSQIQKEALSIIFALKKFYQYLFGRSFILVTDHKPLLSLFGPTKSTPSLAANRLARWALFLSQFTYTIEYRKTKDHQNADALSRLPAGGDKVFDEEESADDIDIVCAIDALDLQVQTPNAASLRKESSKDPIISTVMRFIHEGWPAKSSPQDPVEPFRKYADSLSTCYGCLLYGSRVVIPSKLRPSVLQLLHEGHFGIERMKQLARTSVYWPNIDRDIAELCHKCSTCGEYQPQSKTQVQSWTVPEAPWSRLHIDHAVEFMGYHWLLSIDAFSKYPCIHATTSLSSTATINLLEEDFAHFGYPHTVVTDNATTFKSTEFQTFCKERGMVHITGAPYHPETNGAAERLVRTFKQALRKSSLPPKQAVLEFLQQYRRTPTPSGYSPSQLLNNRQIRTKIDTLLPTPSQVVPRQNPHNTDASEVTKRHFKPGDPCYALSFTPRRSQDPRWVPAEVIKRQGSRIFLVRLLPHGPTWRRHMDQLQPRYASSEDQEPGETPAPTVDSSAVSTSARTDSDDTPTVPEFGPHNPRRSSRRRRPPARFGL